MISPATKAFMASIVGGESDGSYNLLNGGKRFSGYSDHPYAGTNKNTGYGLAAGKYQFMPGTWNDYKRKLKLPDFSPQSQEIAALALARDRYRAKTGGNLDRDLEAGKVMQAAKALSPTWTSLPGGAERNKHTASFLDRYRRNLGAGAPMQLASNSYGGTMTDVPPNDTPRRQSLADFRAQRRAQPTAAQPTIPEGGFAAFRAKQQEARGKKVDFDLSLKDGLTATVTDAPPKLKDDQNFAQHLGAGVGRGLKDLPGGLAEIAGRVDESEGFRGMFDVIPVPDFVKDFKAKNRQREHDAIQAVRDWNAKDEAEYQAKHGDSGFATAGRIGGNVATAFVPGTGQMNAAKGIAGSLAAGKTGMAMLKGAGLGAAQGAVLGTQSADDSIVNNAGIGALAGGAGTLAGVGIGKLLGNDTGRRLVQSADGDAANLLSRLQSGNVEYVPNAGVTTAQAAQLPGISQALRAIKNRGVVGGAGAVLDKETMQNVARLNAVRGIANPAGMTSIEAAERAGGQISKQVGTDLSAAKAATSALYDAPALQSSVVDLTGVKAGDIYKGAFAIGDAEVGGNAALRNIANVIDTNPSLPFSDLQKLRAAASDIANTANIAGDKNLSRVASSITSKLDDAVSSIPEAAAARAARAAQGQQFETGWVGDITRKGADGMPRLSGAQVAKGAFSPAVDQAERMALFNRAADTSSKQSLKDYAIADMLESSAKAGGDDLVLNPSAAKWIDRRSEALGGLLQPDEMTKLQGVGNDLKRAASAEDLGGVRGSATAQNQELLRLGLLDSPLWKLGAKTPLAGTVLEYMSEAQRTALTKKLAKAMADPKTAEKAVKEYMRMQTVAPAMGLLGGVSAPAMMGLLQ